ncbi:hypothetical protein MPL3356_120009 [Mesorhizobium plurifarium]|nr:hypothetical protein MPL3356_120009 [Mesorhizobium plurifarium]
MDQSKT